MKQKNGIHFEISERKVLLGLLDILMAFLGIYILSIYTDFEYLSISVENTVPLVVLAIYITLFGTVFEIYDLQKASKLDVSFKNIVLCISIVVLFYLLTPVITPFLPEARLQIVYFYVALIVFIFLWRVLYNTLIATPRFYKHILLVGDLSNIDNAIYTGYVEGKNLDISKFVNFKSIGNSNFKLDINGRGFTSKYLNSQVTGKIEEISFNNKMDFGNLPNVFGEDSEIHLIDFQKLLKD